MQILCLLGDILHDLALRCIFRQYDHFLHVVGNILFRSFVGAVVADILIAFRRILRIVDIVQKCISRICIGCLGRYKSGHNAEAQSLLGIYHFQIRSRLQCRRYLGSIQERCCHLTADQIILRIIVIDHTDIGSQTQKLLSCCPDHIQILGVEGFSHGL